jgi:anti-sigma factor ChrR (cupin superfamily)
MEGLSVRILHFDRESGRMSSIVRFKAGTVYPRHRHAVAEELFILEGQVEVNGISMGPGDYCRAEPHSVHQPAYAVTDAVILVRNSVHDEYE